jgi:hypothetical protein
LDFTRAARAPPRGGNDQFGEDDIGKAPQFQIRHRPLGFQFREGVGRIVAVGLEKYCTSNMVMTTLVGAPMFRLVIVVLAGPRSR